MGSIEKVFSCLGFASLIHFEIGSWKMIEFANDSFIILHTLPESTRTFVAVFPITTGKLTASTENVKSDEDTEATQLSSSDEFFHPMSISFPVQGI